MSSSSGHHGPAPLLPLLSGPLTLVPAHCSRPHLASPPVPSWSALTPQTVSGVSTHRIGDSQPWNHLGTLKKTENNKNPASSPTLSPNPRRWAQPPRIQAHLLLLCFADVILQIEGETPPSQRLPCLLRRHWLNCLGRNRTCKGSEVCLHLWDLTFPQVLHLSSRD